MKKWISFAVVTALIACGTAAMAYREDFNSSDLSGWTVYANGGDVRVSNGSLLLSTNATGEDAFPYVVLKTNPFPSGDFIMRVGMTFPSVNPLGTGLVAGTLAPANGLVMSNYDQYRCWQYWADTNWSTTNNTNPHILEWDYSNGLTTFKMDTVPQSSVNDPMYSVQVFDPISRPTTIWIGNGRVMPGNTSVAWTSIAIDYIEVDAVPEPSSMLTLVCGFGGIGGLMLRRRRI